MQGSADRIEGHLERWGARYCEFRLIEGEIASVNRPTSRHFVIREVV